jgi:hypothetical protein
MKIIQVSKPQWDAQAIFSLGSQFEPGGNFGEHGIKVVTVYQDGAAGSEGIPAFRQAAICAAAEVAQNRNPKRSLWLRPDQRPLSACTDIKMHFTK